MSTNLSHYTLFSTLTLFTLGSMQIPAMAISSITAPSTKQEATAGPFRAQGIMQLAQANTCRRISKSGGTLLYNNSSGTSGDEVLQQGTSVKITNNVKGNFIQISAVNGKPKVGFVNKLTLALCASPPPKGATECYRVRDVAGIDPGGLVVRKYPYWDSEKAALQLQVGTVFRVLNPPQALKRDRRYWVQIVPINGVEGYVNDGLVGDQDRNLEPASCPGVK